MAVLSQPVVPASWREPDGIAPRGTLVLIPGRGEHPALYARFGRRIASDGYRVHVVADATQDAGLTAAQVADLLAAPARPGGGSGEAATAGSWEEELDTRTACPAHRAQLSGDALRKGALYEPVPAGWAKLADLGAVTQPVLGIHGADDPVSPLAAARERYAAAARAELVSIAGGRHDALNDLTHRSVAATIVLFLERLRLGPQRPVVAVTETLVRAS